MRLDPCILQQDIGDGMSVEVTEEDSPNLIFVEILSEYGETYFGLPKERFKNFVAALQQAAEAME